LGSPLQAARCARRHKHYTKPLPASQKKIMKNLILLLITLITYSSFGQNISEFSIVGKTKDISNGTILLVQNPLTNKFIDSVKVIDNYFFLNTQPNDFPIKLTLWRDSSTAKSIWVEDKKMTFDSSDSSFENATISGSVTDSLATSLRNTIKELKSLKEMQSYVLEFIENNPNSILSAYNLSNMAPVFGQKESTKLYDKFSTKNKQSQYGKKVSDYLALDIDNTPQIGERYTDFTMNNPNGEQEKLSELEGKYILLEFWASWCIPCRIENPELVRVYNKYKRKDFEIFAVSLDEKKENWIQAIKKDKLNWKHVSDLKGRGNLVSLVYGVNFIPDNVLIDKSGIIIARNVRSSQLDKMLSDLLLKKVEITKNTQDETIIRLNSSMTYKDENGNILTELEAMSLLKTENYNPHVDTEKNIMTLKKAI
jgi:peroxiredoxin